MKILISGGSGFIGKNLLNFLSHNNENIMVIGRNLNSITHENVKKLKLDLNNSDANYHEIIKYNPDVFVHLAWEGIPDYSKKICRKNYFNSVKLIRMLVNSTSCSKIISTGSCWEYNDGYIKGKCKEDLIINPQKPFSIYKNKIYKEVFEITKKKKILFNWLRLFYVYGLGQKKRSIIPMIIQNLRYKKKLNIINPANANDYIHVDDVVKIIHKFILKNIKSGIYNVGTGKAVKVQRLLKIIDTKINGTDNISKEYLGKININKKSQNFFACTQKLKKYIKNFKFKDIESGIDNLIKFYKYEK